MNVRWMSDGCQMDVRWMSDGSAPWPRISCRSAGICAGTLLGSSEIHQSSMATTFTTPPPPLHTTHHHSTSTGTLYYFKAMAMANAAGCIELSADCTCEEGVNLKNAPQGSFTLSMPAMYKGERSGKKKNE